MIGSLCVPETSAQDDAHQYDAKLKEADVALYRAKEWGRNRAVLAKPSGLKEIWASRMTQDPISAA
jgi:hypothetical protein